MQFEAAKLAGHIEQLKSLRNLVCMNFNRIFAFSLFLVGSMASAQEWSVTQIGPGPNKETYDLVIGDVRNDQTDRVYVSTKNGAVYEWSYDQSSTSWSYKIIQSNLKGLVTIDYGDARHDGKNRLYFTEFVDQGRLFEAEWDGSDWKTTLIETGYHSLSLVVGDGRNDGKDYLYIGSTNVGTWELDWKDTGWAKTQLHFQASEGVGVVGASKNDGVNRLLFTSDKVREYTWSGSKFNMDSPSPKIEWPDAIDIGQGRNDGINRIYANCFNGRGRLEYTWNGTSWTETMINPVVHRGDLYLAAVKADGKARVYTTTSEYFKGKAGNFLEFEWNSANISFDSTILLDATSGATAMIYAGYGRGDDTMRLYASNYVKGTIYELTNTNPYVRNAGSVGKPINLYESFSVTKNPVTSLVGFELVLPEPADFTIELANFMGETLRSKTYQNTQSIQDQIQLNTGANTYPSGLYYLRVRVNGQAFARRVMVL